jgi:hypothetical protein
MFKLNYKTAVALAAAELDKMGANYVYTRHEGKGSDPYGPACRYAENGEGDCIVGRILVSVGVPAQDLEWRSRDDFGLYAANGAESVLDAMDRDNVLYATAKARKFLISLQAMQDCGKTWGASMDHALDNANRKKND